MVKNVGHKREKRLKEESEQEERKDFKDHLADKEREIETLLLKIDDFKYKMAENEKNAELLSKLYESGVIDEHGTPQKYRENENDMN